MNKDQDDLSIEKIFCEIHLIFRFTFKVHIKLKQMAISYINRWSVEQIKANTTQLWTSNSITGCIKNMLLTTRCESFSKKIFMHFVVLTYGVFAGEFRHFVRHVRRVWNISPKPSSHQKMKRKKNGISYTLYILKTMPKIHKLQVLSFTNAFSMYRMLSIA